MSSSSEPVSSSDEDYKQEDDDQGSSSSSHDSASRSSSDTDGKSRARSRRGRNGTPTSAASKSPLTSTSASTSTSLSSSRSPPGNSREDGGRSKSTRTVKAGASLLWREEDSKDYGAGDEEDDDEDEEEEDERKLRSKVKQRGGGSGRNYGSGNGSAKGKSVPAPAPKRRRTGGTSRNSTSATAAAVNYNPGWTTKPSSKSPPSKQSLAWDKAREKPSEHIKHFFEFMRQKEEKLTQHPVHIILSDDESTDKHTETASADGASRPPLSTHKSTILAPNSDSDFDPSPIKPRVHVIPDSPLQRAGAPLFPSKVSQSSENTEISSPIKGDCASSPGESSNTKCTSNSDGMLECPICGLTMPRWRENDMQTHINHELNKAESIPANAHPLSTGAFKLPPELEETSSEEDLPPQMRTSMHLNYLLLFLIFSLGTKEECLK
ncbi:hypothetical protein Pelo_13507 [Pelomyxa schiedti]|nr:hypothetical protein Pelo_13507 [Pelomyxa schiedti]